VDILESIKINVKQKVVVGKQEVLPLFHGALTKQEIIHVKILTLLLLTQDLPKMIIILCMDFSIVILISEEKEELLLLLIDKPQEVVTIIIGLEMELLL
jgi:hypothetical protein